MTEDEFAEFIGSVIEENVTSTVRSFFEAGVLTSNEGIVVRLASGETFQVTVVRSA